MCLTNSMASWVCVLYKGGCSVQRDGFVFLQIDFSTGLSCYTVVGLLLYSSECYRLRQGIRTIRND